MLPEIALHLAYGMASGMAEMHRQHILHRDLKSANVLLELRPLLSGGDKPLWMNDPKLAEMAKKISGVLGQNSLAGGVGWGVESNGKPCTHTFSNLRFWSGETDQGRSRNGCSQRVARSSRCGYFIPICCPRSFQSNVSKKRKVRRC
jgi:serine/threonine protein kinase